MTPPYIPPNTPPYLSPTPYVDSGDTSLVASLIPNTYRDNIDLPLAITLAEQDVIAHFTFPWTSPPTPTPWIPWWDTPPALVPTLQPTAPPDGAVWIADGLYVGLRGYALDSAESEPTFRRVFQRVIAGVAVWRLAQYQRKPGEDWLMQGANQVRMKPNSDDPFPAGAFVPLAIYDVRPIQDII